MSGTFRMLTSIASSEGWSYRIGEDVRPGGGYGPGVVLAATLAGWVAGGIAEPVAQRPETATLPAPENAMLPGPAPEMKTTAPTRRKNRR